jgi:type IV secretion system protein VirD4
MYIYRWTWKLLKAVWWMLCMLALATAWTGRQLRTQSDNRARGALGTARWASRFELFRAGVWRGVGPVVGKGAFGRLMRFNSDGIMQVFASTGSGKGLGIVIPTLLDYPGSIVVTDVKGENYAITARHRRTRGRVVMLNPSDLSRSARFNPLDIIRVGTDHEQDDAMMLADLMVVRDSAEGHWASKSISLLAAFILHTVHDPDPVNRTLANVRKLSVGEPLVMRSRIHDIATSSPASLAQSIAHGFLGTMGSEDKPPNEFLSVLSDLHKATEPWTEGTPTGRLSATSTFSLADLTGDEPVTLYFCVDEEKLRSYARWLRVMTGCVLASLMRAKYQRRPRHKVLLLLDEVRVLGRLDVLAENAGLLRAYCTPVLIWQNMPQVRAVYGNEADAFLANASCRVFFGIVDNDTAHQVSQICGQTPVQVRSQGTSQQSDAWLRENRSQGESEGGYWLIDPSEVQRLPTTRAIVKMRHVAHPILTTRADYRHVLRWANRWDRWDPSASAPVPPDYPSRPPDPPRAPIRQPAGHGASPTPPAPSEWQRVTATHW